MTDVRLVAKTLIKRRTRAPGEGPPRRLRLGPWTIAAALTGLVVVLGQDYLLPPPRPVILPAHIQGSGRIRWMAEPVSSLLESRSRLRLSRFQQERLRSLAGDEATRTRALEEQIKRDQEQFGRFVQSARSHGGASLPALQQQGEPLVADAAELSQLRREFWSKALSVLTPPQRNALSAKRPGV